ncbi:MAG: serine/threonine-protein kinase [Tahibacter sp.]
MNDPNAHTTTQAQLRHLFEACADLPPQAREAFLREQGVTESVHKLMDAMLSADLRTQDVFSTPAADWADQLQAVASEVEALVGTRIGGFHIAALLGQGGSAVVFRAEREVGGAIQTVALKLMRHGLFSSEAQRRFQREQAILIQLSHPNIAHLIDAGISSAGIPYIAMEYVDGMSVTEYARVHALNEPARLRLLAELGRAVDAAHRALIVHRDLKPSNVLVSVADEIKVLDFGIAKLLDNSGEVETSTQHIALTPGYAAPEQYRSGPVTTAADVYSLGVIASELLLGARLGADASLPRETEDSEVIRRRWRALDPDLATVLRTALATDPVQRYSSARHYADDIERYLRNEPIAARAPTRAYRARKFVERHRLGVFSSVAFVVALIAALGLALWQTRLARQEARRANSVSAFVEGLFAPLRDGIAEGKQPSLTELVGQGVSRIDQTGSLGPTERVDLLLLFARVYDYLNEREQMTILTHRASELADAELGRNHPLAQEAAVSYALSMLRKSEYAKVKPLLDDAEQRLHATGTRGYSWIRLNDGLALLANDSGDPTSALAYERAALAERIAMNGPDSDDAIGGYSNLGFALEGVGRFGEAADAYRRVYASRVSRTGSESSRSATSLGGLGSAELMAGDLGAALEHLRGAMRVFDSLGGKPRNAQVQCSQQACTAEIAVGSAAAAAVCAHAVDLARQSETTPGNSVGRALRLQALQVLQDGQLADARKLADQSLATFAADAPANWKGRSEMVLGEIQLHEGHPDQAAQTLANGIEHLGGGYPPYLRRYGLALLALACDRGDGLAAACANHPAERATQDLAADSYAWNALLLPANSALAQIALRHGDIGAATARLRSAVTAAQNQHVESSHPRLLEAQLWLIVSEASAGNCPAASTQALALGATLRPQAAHVLLQDALAALRSNARCVVTLDAAGAPG